MSTRTETQPWLAQALELSSSLYNQNETSGDRRYAVQTPESSPPTQPNTYKFGNDISAKDFVTPSKRGLGDFSKIWLALGSPLDLPASLLSPKPAERSIYDALPRQVDYTSDGATYVKTATNGKTVTWQDEQSADDTMPDTITDRSASPESPTLTKKQLKRQRQKERKAKEAAVAMKHAMVSESEADVAPKRTPARKASAHVVPATEPTKKYGLRERDTSGKAVTASGPQPSVALATSRVAEKLAALKNGQPPSTPTKNNTGPKPGAKETAKSTRQQSLPASAPAQKPILPEQMPQHGIRQPQWPVTNAATAQAMKFIPSTVQPQAQPAANITNTPSAAPTQVVAPVSKPKHVIEPKIVRSGEDRHWALLMKLIGDFWQDRKYIISPMNLTTHNNDPNGIHVFVDASNIFIGFTDQLKRSRGIPDYARVPQVDLSFDALALLMERRRPVAKRVLAGSTPHMPAFDKAKAVGYECSILEKVYKARELTERQIYFQERDRGGRKKDAKASGSGSETNAPQYAPARMIEQGVDEILHLKILESVVDSETPSTIVLATGDAAQAEYSSGFMAMAERALKKGWCVELVSWSKNINMMYLRKEFSKTWGEKFRVIYLDDYAEELLEM